MNIKDVALLQKVKGKLHTKHPNDDNETQALDTITQHGLKKKKK
jgi:hypothetical protein